MSAARPSTAASSRGADDAAAEAADDTAIPDVRHAANTSKVDAAARVSASFDSEADIAELSAAIRTRTLDGPVAISSAAANIKVAVLMTASDP
jgi:uncharacterized protein involved in copper resistance